MTTLQKIVHYGLSIRQIPSSVTYTYNRDYRCQEGGTLIEREYLDIPYDKFITRHCRDIERGIDTSKYFRIDREAKKVFRLLTQRIVIPSHASEWMSKQVKNTDSKVEWNIKKDNCAKSLDDSVDMCVTSITISR